MLQSKILVGRNYFQASCLKQRKKLCKDIVKRIPQANHYSTLSDPDFLHESIVPTEHFQKSLPRLPIPPLEKTCERYLTAQEVILTPEELEKTAVITNYFKNHDGQELNNILIAEDKKNKHTSYVTEAWFDMYLKARESVVLNYNPFIVFHNDPKPEYQNQLLRATNMLVSSMRYLKTYRSKVLEPEVFHLNPGKSDTLKFRNFVRRLPESISWYGAYWYKAFPLDMSQYFRLFNSTRIPKHGKDELFTDETAKHILVMRNGNYYIFDVIDRDGMVLAPDVIMAHLNYILQDSRPAPEYPVGVLTSENRDTWATIRQQLLNSGNENTLQLIDSAAFVLTLDDCAPKDPNDITKNFLHGDGKNRWFDKSFSLIFDKEGVASANFEHSWGDGVAVVRYINEIYKDSTENPKVHPDTKPANVDSSKIVQCLDFKLDNNVKEAIKTAKINFDKHVGALDQHHLEYFKITKKTAKEFRMSPDSLMQLAIQMAYYKQNGKFVATYESCSTAAFKHGRTETMRPATMYTKQACEMICKQNITASQLELGKALMNCSDLHNKLTKDAAMGNGFDRHLFALRNLAEKNGMKTEMFSDPNYTKINHIILSTSTVASPSINIGGFAPVVRDGYGVGYSIEDNRIGYNVTSYPPATNVRDFIQCLNDSLDDIYEIFHGRIPRQSAK
ncbi:CPT2 [Mytilus coruscus]|uniref:CPT2 n=1 Tax=Mytilus coruscus TaxID=42192 RepID=A0A6J8EZU8_MYTCO|nr:CPT2 [Mytilus coruscus]